MAPAAWGECPSGSGFTEDRKHTRNAVNASTVRATIPKIISCTGSCQSYLRKRELQARQHCLHDCPTASKKGGGAAEITTQRQPQSQ